MSDVTLRRIGVLVGLQLLLIGAVLTPSAFTSVTGEEVVVETAPVDPRDLFRGDYVDLRYEISTVTVADQGFERGDEIYVLLRSSGAYHEAAGVSRDRPDLAEGEACLEGRIEGVGGASGSGQVRLEVDYGLDSYFIPEGTGEPDRDAKVDARLKVDVFCHAVIDTLLVNGEPWPP